MRLEIKTEYGNKKNNHHCTISMHFLGEFMYRNEMFINRFQICNIYFFLPNFSLLIQIKLLKKLEKIDRSKKKTRFINDFRLV